MRHLREVEMAGARTLAAAVVAVGLTVTAEIHGATEDKRAFEISDYYRTAFIGAPVASPGGERIAFAVTRYDLEAGKSWSEIWMMRAEGAGLRQMTQGRHGDTSPVFSPDGRFIAFRSQATPGYESDLYRMPSSATGSSPHTALTRRTE
jgi:dipeptidyl aminopeptidase/acylaminoacyl peptidase